MNLLNFQLFAEDRSFDIFIFSDRSANPLTFE